jgi:predicted metal-dependent HD superfamily phosphohydrolase
VATREAGPAIDGMGDWQLLYRTPHGRRQWERQAHNNIRAELEQLRGPVRE